MPDASPHRELFRASAELLVLAVLADGPRWGYAIEQRLDRATGHTLGAGSLYPLLHRLEDAGLIAAQWDRDRPRPRKAYRLTPQGEQQLKHDAAAWQAALARQQAVVLPALRRVTNHPTTGDHG